MPKVGRFVTDPRAGAYCQVTLDSGEKIVVNHEKGGFKGALLTVEASRMMGFRSERVFTCDLDSPQGEAALARLTRGAQPGSVEATPLAAFVAYVKDAGSLAELRTRCAALMSSGESPWNSRRC